MTKFKVTGNKNLEIVLRAYNGLIYMKPTLKLSSAHSTYIVKYINSPMKTPTFCDICLFVENRFFANNLKTELYFLTLFGFARIHVLLHY